MSSADLLQARAPVSLRALEEAVDRLEQQLHLIHPPLQQSRIDAAVEPIDDGGDRGNRSPGLPKAQLEAATVASKTDKQVPGFHGRHTVIHPYELHRQQAHQMLRASERAAKAESMDGRAVIERIRWQAHATESIRPAIGALAPQSVKEDIDTFLFQAGKMASKRERRRYSEVMQRAAKSQTSQAADTKRMQDTVQHDLKTREAAEHKKSGMKRLAASFQRDLDKARAFSPRQIGSLGAALQPARPASRSSGREKSDLAAEEDDIERPTSRSSERENGDLAAEEDDIEPGQSFSPPEQKSGDDQEPKAELEHGQEPTSPSGPDAAEGLSGPASTWIGDPESRPTSPMPEKPALIPSTDTEPDRPQLPTIPTPIFYDLEALRRKNQDMERQQAKGFFHR